MVWSLTLHQLELPCPTTAHSNIPHPAKLDHIMQRLHGLFDRRLFNQIDDIARDRCKPDQVGQAIP